MRPVLLRDTPADAAFFGVLVCWLGFGSILLVGRRRAAKKEIQRHSISRVGFLLQGLGYAIEFVLIRNSYWPFAPNSLAPAIALSAITIVLAVASVAFCLAAALTLGKQWALAARLVEHHELITSGPYSVVRNPIYLAMFGMLIATGLAVSRWEAILAGTVVFLVGNEIRIRSEERLLRGAFGPQFEEYARRVPSFFPRLLRWPAGGPGRRAG
jgi:protein-S-isoprenylcysteine O-methyltransferase Ste14